MSVRKNTLVVDFSVLPKRPDAGAVQQFLEKKVKLKLEDTTCIQLHNIRNVVYIEAIDSETALRYEKANHYKHTITCNNKEFKIPVYVDSEAVTVRVHDLPTHIPHLTVTDFMGQYGVVISISRERWKHHFPGFYNGVRVLRMRLSRSIPSLLCIAGEETLVSYRGQPRTCHHCGKSAHPKQKCAKTSATSTNTKISPTPAGDPCASEPQWKGEEFPSLSPIPNSESEKQQNNNNNEINTTSDKGDDDDGEDNSDDDGNSSSDENDFFEATTRKRRMAKREANELKKKCVSTGTGSQKIEEESNRFQLLEQLDPMSTSVQEMEDYNYSNRLRSKQKV